MSEAELKHVFELYQEFTPTTALYPEAGTRGKLEILYLGLGLLGEYQEWLESGYDIKEAGDIFWYISQLANVYGWDLYTMYITANDERSIYDFPNLAERLKKFIRDGEDPSMPLFAYAQNVIKLIKYRYTYFAAVVELEEVIKKTLMQNKDKLIDRQNRDMLQGNGDNR